MFFFLALWIIIMQKHKFQHELKLLKAPVLCKVLKHKVLFLWEMTFTNATSQDKLFVLWTY